MQHLDEGTIHAWIDHALDADDAARVEAHVQTCAQCSAAVAEARGLVAAASRILGYLDDVPAQMIPAGAMGAPVVPRAAALPPRPIRWYQQTPVRVAMLAAATVMIGVVGVKSARPRLAMNGAQQSAVPLMRPETHPATTAAAPVMPAPTPTVASPKQYASSPAHDSAIPAALAESVVLRREAEMHALRGAMMASMSANKTASTDRAAQSDAVHDVLHDASRDTLIVRHTTPCGQATVTTYATPAGAEVTLIAGDSAQGRLVAMCAAPETALNQMVVTGMAAPQAAPAPLAMNRAAEEPRVHAPTRAPMRTANSTDSTPPQTMHTLRWTDPHTKRVYVLRGALSDDALAVIRRQLGLEPKP